MAFDAVIRTIFSDSGVSIGLARANAALKQLEQAGPTAGRGMRVAEQGLRALAFEAAGIQGPLGRVIEGLLRFGGGSALILGAAAGVGLVALAYKEFTAEAREAEKAQVDFITALAQTGPSGKAIAERSKLDEMTARRDKLREDQRGLLASMGLPFEDSSEIVKLNTEIATQATRVQAAEVAAAEAAKKHREELEKQVEKAHELADAVDAISRDVNAYFASPFNTFDIDRLRTPGLEDILAGENQRQAGLAVDRLGQQGQQFFLNPGTSDQIRQIGVDIDNTLAESALKSKDASATVVASFGAMAQAAIMGSDQMASAVIAGFGAILRTLPSIDPLTGSIIGAVTGIFGALFGGGHRDPVPVKVTNPEDLKQPPSQTEIIVSPSGDITAKTRYELARRERLGLSDRMGG